jgi:hypothetical protein
MSQKKQTIQFPQLGKLSAFNFNIMSNYFSIKSFQHLSWLIKHAKIIMEMKKVPGGVSSF